MEVGGYSCSYVLSGRLDQVGYHRRRWRKRDSVSRGGFWFGQELGRGALRVACTAVGRGGSSGPRTLMKLRIGFGGILFRNAVDVGSCNDCDCWFWLTVLRTTLVKLLITVKLSDASLQLCWLPLGPDLHRV